jgi:hypothetical protein
MLPVSLDCPLVIAIFFYILYKAHLTLVKKGIIALHLYVLLPFKILNFVLFKLVSESSTPIRCVAYSI